MKSCDVVVIGAGIVGLASAYEVLSRFPGTTVIVVEKEHRVAAHQSGHNSGVLHSGIYYRPGSLKAQNCRAGKLAMEEFCQREEIPFDLCGKVIVAVEESQLPTLQEIYRRGQLNGVQCSMIDRQQLKDIEPHAAGIEAIHVPEAGIVDYPAVCQRLAERIEQLGGEILFGEKVVGISQTEQAVQVRTNISTLQSQSLITCGGLWSDRLIALSGEVPEALIVPFRGEFYSLKQSAQHLCRGLIYPVPDPNFPFLGVHFTKTMKGGVECGPNAVLAFARDGYRKTNLNLRDLMESLGNRRFQRMARRYWKTGLGEMWRSWNKGAFVKALQKLVPEIRAEHLVVAPAGVRAQSLSEDGSLLDDFVIQKTGRIIHVGNAPSPAATASLNIARLIVDQLGESPLS